MQVWKQCVRQQAGEEVASWQGVPCAHFLPFLACHLHGVQTILASWLAGGGRREGQEGGQPREWVELGRGLTAHPSLLPGAAWPVAAT